MCNYLVSLRMSSLISCKYDFKCNLVAILLFSTVCFAFFLQLTSKEAAKCHATVPNNDTVSYFSYK